MSLVFWDSMLFVYLVEENPRFIDRVIKLRRRMTEHTDRLYQRDDARRGVIASLRLRRR